MLTENWISEILSIERKWPLKDEILHMKKILRKLGKKWCRNVGKKYWRCKLHDVVRELSLKLGKREDIGVHSLEYQSGKLSILLWQAFLHMKIHHLVIHFRAREVAPEPDKLGEDKLGEDSSKHLRSLQIFNLSNSIEFPSHSIVDFRNFKLLRYLFMVGFKFARRKLPKGITNLAHLRCLRLEDCEFDKLPSPIRNFVDMDTLDLFGSNNVEVPNVFKEMLRLKHLLHPNYKKKNIGGYRLTLDEGIVELETPQLDSRVHKLKCMNKMKNLRRFSTKIHDNESLSTILDAIVIMDKLVFCGVEIKEDCELGTNEGVLKKAFTCPNLHVLFVEVKLGKVLAECKQNFISSKLTTLSLSDCEIEDDPITNKKLKEKEIQSHRLRMMNRRAAVSALNQFHGRGFLKRWSHRSGILSQDCYT